MDGFSLTPIAANVRAVEVMERKNSRHPGTICDALAEQLSRDLSAAYRARFGAIPHHNVDKALLSAGRSAPAFGAAGSRRRSRSTWRAGRAEGGGETIPAAEIAVEAARTGVPWVNDTTVDAGYAPLSRLSARCSPANAPAAKADPGQRLARGEDVKVMGVRS